ncbi:MULTISPECIES: protein translocase SEC61 complex subunit gamma [Natronorubrum]|uniref:Protein translocase subunit SecE n=2 Tax=Natronorubrum TaxID=134813 RepID=A0A1N7BZ94_9EURY|nr:MULTISPECIES: protein translocase SEC61 complex subunit gamma [Natronorubrum]APX98192.1 protein translocase SEC61 complex subunit gamma [Natronorubrum daqingense]SEH15782.1 protein transport protein SEC61 subunit gamma [Natronorubrum sediminis]SIR56669.1 protein transport protein SEC61 subunit gamma [Natronorubrum daqingense]
MDVPYDLTSYVRVLKMATTPTTEEFLQVSKIAGAGILLVGLMGFLIGGIMLFLPAGGGL